MENINIDNKPINNEEQEIIKENTKFKKISFKDFDKTRIDAIKSKIQTIKARNSDRSGMNATFEYNTEQEKEPINEWRSQKEFS